MRKHPTNSWSGVSLKASAGSDVSYDLGGSRGINTSTFTLSKRPFIARRSLRSMHILHSAFAYSMPMRFVANLESARYFKCKIIMR